MTCCADDIRFLGRTIWEESKKNTAAIVSDKSVRVSKALQDHCEILEHSVADLASIDA